MATIQFVPADKHATLPHTVALRAAWSDAWTIEPGLYCQSALGAVAPSVGRATLGVREYGRGIPVGGTIFQLIQPLTGRQRYYVRVAFSRHIVAAATDSLAWYGTLEVDTDRLLGWNGTTQRGQQEFNCIGLGGILDREKIRKSYYLNASANQAHAVDIAPPFNHERYGNRAANKAGGVYAFTDKIGRRETDEFWSTRDIVEYLLEYMLPRNAAGDPTIDWEISDPNGLLPTWDQPVVEQEGRTPKDVLDQLLSSSRLLGYVLGVSDDGTKLQLRPFTYTGADVQLNAGTIKANPTQHDLIFETDPDCEATLELSTAQQIDQVILRGAKRRSCCSLGFASNNLEIGWPAALQTEYEAGASTDPNYPASTEIADRQRMDAEARAAEKFRSVFSRFAIPETWSGFAHDGTTATSQSSQSPVFRDDDDPDLTIWFNPRWVRMLDRLPILEGWSYTTPGSQSGKISDGPHDELPPLVFSPVPEDGNPASTRRWVQLDRNADASEIEDTEADANRRISVDVIVPDFDRALLIEVNGGPQHAIATGNFTPLAHEDDKSWGGYDYEEFVFTVCLEDQRYCEARYPADADIAEQNEIRRDVIYVGDDYRLDYIVPNTVWGIAPDTGLLQKTAGGFINDDRNRLADLAKAYFSYLGTERRTLSFTSGRINTALKLGDYITTVGTNQQRTVNSVITSMEITIDQGEGGGPLLQSIRYTTDYAELAANQVF